MEAVLKHVVVEVPTDDTPLPTLHAAIDLQFEDLMSEKRAVTPCRPAEACLQSQQVVGIAGSAISKPAQVLMQKNEGFDNYIWHTMPLARLYFRNP